MRQILVSMWRLFLLSCAALSSLPAQEHFFPLEVGNVWIYRGGGTRATAPLILEITEARTFDEVLYYRLHGEPGGDYWLRFREDGSLVDRDGKLWYAFQSPVGQTFDTAIPFCCGKAMLSKYPAKYDPPSGLYWANAKEFSFPGVFQVGLTREIFAPYIGMVYRALNTGGPSVATYDLAYARIGGVTVLSEPVIGFTVAANPYFVRLSLENGTGPLFGTYTVVLQDSEGNEAYRESDTLGSPDAQWLRHWFAFLPKLKPRTYTVRGSLSSGAWSATTTLTIPAPASDETSQP